MYFVSTFDPIKQQIAYVPLFLIFILFSLFIMQKWVGTFLFNKWGKSLPYIIAIAILLCIFKVVPGVCYFAFNNGMVNDKCHPYIHGAYTIHTGLSTPVWKNSRPHHVSVLVSRVAGDGNGVLESGGRFVRRLIACLSILFSSNWNMDGIKGNIHEGNVYDENISILLCWMSSTTMSSILFWRTNPSSTILNNQKALIATRLLLLIINSC